MLKNYRYVFLLVHVEPGDGHDEANAFAGLTVEPDVYADERSLPGAITAAQVRRAKQTIGEPVFSVQTMSWLFYCPVRGK